MQRNVCVAVAEKPQRIRHLHAAENQLSPFHQTVYVIPLSDSHHGALLLPSFPTQNDLSCQQHILRRRQLDVFHIAFRQMDGNAHPLDQCRIIRRAFAMLKFRMRTPDKLGGKRLRGLYRAKPVPRRRVDDTACRPRA